MYINKQKGKKAFQASWQEVGGKKCYFRSKWEYRYALYLELQKKYGHIKDWEHEPHTFYFEGIKRGTNNYKPDFKVVFPNDKEIWYEVKGYVDAKTFTKVQRMKKYHPNIILKIIDELWFITVDTALKKVLPEW